MRIVSLYTIITMLQSSVAFSTGSISISTARHAAAAAAALWRSTSSTAISASSSSSPLSSSSSSSSSSDSSSSSFFETRQDGCWRPTVNDVERISWGKPAKKKGTGSRGVPHRLNDDERFQFDLGRSNGFLQVTGSAWRSQRREAPLLNTYRSLCDARAQVSIVLHKQNDGIDELVVDLSPLRLPATFAHVAQRCLEEQGGGEVTYQGAGTGVAAAADEEDEEDNETANATTDQDDDDDDDDDDDSWESRPIYQLPPFCITWELPRSEAKTLGKKFASLFNTAEGKKAASRKPVGVKPGKNRRSGGYGIG